MESIGTLPSSEEIRFATICGSHANMAARAIMHGSMVHDIPNEWRRAIQDGAEWKVIKAVVWQQFPELVDMVCQSGNTNQGISKQEDEMQLLNKIDRHARLMVAVERRSGRTWQARLCAHDQSVDLQVPQSLALW